VIAEALAADYEALDIAAAAIRLASATDADGESTSEEDLNIAVSAPTTRTVSAVAVAHADHGPAAQRDHKKPDKKRKRSARGGDIVRLFVSIGRKAGVRPADLVGAIANESGINARMIGSIEISDNFSLVEVPDDQADDIIGALKDATIRGTRVKVRREKF
jgi:ATP-dependent RNA helicase DeaD